MRFLTSKGSTIGIAGKNLIVDSIATEVLLKAVEWVRVKMRWRWQMMDFNDSELWA